VLEAASVRQAIGSSFFDTALIAEPASLAAVRCLGGAGRVVFGSDWPFAARLYEEAGTLQPAIDQTFAEDARGVRRANVQAQFPPLRARR
jgi:predicted TIM-barrel fold metal-dependent hydrolase